jgi:hypothetical protein
MTSARRIRLAISLLLLATAASAQSIHFNDAWWEKARNQEQEGFIWGYLDSPCIPPISASGNDYIQFLNDYLPKHPTVSVPAAMHVAATRMEPRKVVKGGDIWTEAHGFMDGDWWGDSHHGELDEKSGYVEAYLACKTGFASSHDVAKYVDAIDKYYDLPKHEHTKIAYVLEPLITKAPR